MKKIDYSSYKKPSDYISFLEGDTKFVIVSNGYFIKRHGMKTANGYIPMPDCTELPTCPQCLKGNEPKQKWTWIVYSKIDQRVYILDAGPMIGNQICEMAQKGGYDPINREVTINKVGEKLRTKYFVKSMTPINLTADEQNFIKPAKDFLVKKYFEISKS